MTETWIASSTVSLVRRSSSDDHGARCSRPITGTATRRRPAPAGISRSADGRAVGGFMSSRRGSRPPGARHVLRRCGTTQALRHRPGCAAPVGGGRLAERVVGDGLQTCGSGIGAVHEPDIELTRCELVVNARTFSSVSASIVTRPSVVATARRPQGTSGAQTPTSRPLRPRSSSDATPPGFPGATARTRRLATRSRPSSQVTPAAFARAKVTASAVINTSAGAPSISWATSDWLPANTHSTGPMPDSINAASSSASNGASDDGANTSAVSASPLAPSTARATTAAATAPVSAMIRPLTWPVR